MKTFLLFLPQVQNAGFKVPLRVSQTVSPPSSGPLLQEAPVERSICPRSTITFFQYSKYVALSEKLAGVWYINGSAQPGLTISFSPSPQISNSNTLFSLNFFAWEPFLASSVGKHSLPKNDWKSLKTSRSCRTSWWADPIVHWNTVLEEVTSKDEQRAKK